MTNKNEIIDRLNEHNDYCARVGAMLFDAKCGEPRAINVEAADAMRLGNVTVGIELCCIAREAGIDACVDIYNGYVIPQSNKNEYCRTFEFCKE